MQLNFGTPVTDKQLDDWLEFYTEHKNMSNMYRLSDCIPLLIAEVRRLRAERKESDT